jgi:SAM-dependent methyltransferase
VALESLSQFTCRKIDVRRIFNGITTRVLCRIDVTKKKLVWPPLGLVPFWVFYRTKPLTEFGFGRGTPVDRTYIGEFLHKHTSDVNGRVLEFGDRQYTVQFGHNVSASDVIDLFGIDTCANIVADITTAAHIDDEIYDCIISTQVLGFVFDLDAAVNTLHRILKPGGVLLLTVPGNVARIGRYDWQTYGAYWGFTSMSICKLLEKYFPKDNIEVKAWGNVYAANLFQIGLAAEDCNSAKVKVRDDCFQVLVSARAVKK